MTEKPTYAPTPRVKTPEQALKTLMNRCAKSEISISDAMRSLHRWGVAPETRSSIIDTLQQQGFIDEQRFAAAYVREKARLNHWGIYKIRAELRAKQIPEPVIEEALRQLDDMDTQTQLKELLKRKLKTLHTKNNYELRGKLMRYGTARGFDSSDVADWVERLTSDREEYLEE